MIQFAGFPRLEGAENTEQVLQLPAGRAEIEDLTAQVHHHCQLCACIRVFVCVFHKSERPPRADVLMLNLPSPCVQTMPAQGTPPVWSAAPLLIPDIPSSDQSITRDAISLQSSPAQHAQRPAAPPVAEGITLLEQLEGVRNTLLQPVVPVGGAGGDSFSEEQYTTLADRASSPLRSSSHASRTQPRRSPRSINSLMADAEGEGALDVAADHFERELTEAVGRGVDSPHASLVPSHIQHTTFAQPRTTATAAAQQPISGLNTNGRRCSFTYSFTVYIP